MREWLKSIILTCAVSSVCAFPTPIHKKKELRNIRIFNKKIYHTIQAWTHMKSLTLYFFGIILKYRALLGKVQEDIVRIKITMDNS